MAEGYARNFLIPRNLVKIATEKAIREAQENKNKRVAEEQINLEKIRKLAGDLNGREFVIKSKEKDGKLFGSVSKKDIAGVLKDSGVEIKESEITLETPIKKTGEYEIKMELEKGIISKIKLKIQGI